MEPHTTTVGNGCLTLNAFIENVGFALFYMERKENPRSESFFFISKLVAEARLPKMATVPS